jgi:hypothetical protein
MPDAAINCQNGFHFCKLISLFAPFLWQWIAPVPAPKIECDFAPSALRQAALTIPAWLINQMDNKRKDRQFQGFFAESAQTARSFYTTTSG